LFLRRGLTLDGLNKQMRGDVRVSRQTAIILGPLERECLDLPEADGEVRPPPNYNVWSYLMSKAMDATTTFAEAERLFQANKHHLDAYKAIKPSAGETLHASLDKHIPRLDEHSARVYARLGDVSIDVARQVPMRRNKRRR
jgi:hypothetical protein